MSFSFKLFAAAVAFGAGLLLAPAALTLVQAQTSEQPASPPAVGQPSDTELRSFAAATLEIDRLNNQWATRIDRAADVEEKQELRTRAMQEMAAAVREEGLSVSEYNALVSVVEEDPDVARAVDEYRRELSR